MIADRFNDTRLYHRRGGGYDDATWADTETSLLRHVDVRNDPYTMRRYVIFLNGVRQPRAVAANADEGWVLQHLSAAHQVVINPATGQPAMAKLTGKVDIRRLKGEVPHLLEAHLAQGVEVV